MRKGNFTSNIADFLLDVKNYPSPLPKIFHDFSENNLPQTTRLWRLDFEPVNKRSLNRRLKDPSKSLYFGNEIYFCPETRRIIHFQSKRNKNPITNYGDGRFISYCYAQILAANGGLLLHAASVICNGGAYLFLAKSGGGKSTLAELSYPRFEVLGDDIIAVKKVKKRFLAFATPWRQKAFIKSGKAASAPVKAIIFLKKSDKIAFTTLDPHEALMRIVYEHTHFLSFMDAKMAGNVFQNAACFARKVPAFQMAFTRRGDFWPHLKKGLAFKKNETI